MFNIPFHKSTDVIPEDKQIITWIKASNNFGYFSFDFQQTKVEYTWEYINEESDVYGLQYSYDERPDKDYKIDPNYKLVLLDDEGFEFDEVFYWIDSDELLKLVASEFNIELE